jgi:sensor c-di-GMP phosphodiesterase-like protein
VLDVAAVVITVVVVTVVVVTVTAIVVVTAEKISRARVVATEAGEHAGGINRKGADTGGATRSARSATAGLSDLWRTRDIRTGHRGICGRADDFLHGVDHLRRGSTRQPNHRGCRAGGHESQAAMPPGRA